MTAIDFESEYNNRLRVPEHSVIQGRWAQASARFRSEAKADLDVAYGPDERHRVDIFHPKGAVVPGTLVLYIHGGYWQRGERQDYACVAKAFNDRGITVAIAGYRLAPAVGVMDIVGELRLCVKMLWNRLRRRPVVCGHSAGGHLTAALLATDWSLVGGVPADVVRAGYALSGIFDLPPLVHTSINEVLGLTPETARVASPLFWAPPATDRELVASVGGEESSEFLRQSLDIAAAWSQAGVKAECVVVPDTNHFTIVDELMRAESAMVHRIIQFAQASAKD